MLKKFSGWQRAAVIACSIFIVSLLGISAIQSVRSKGKRISYNQPTPIGVTAREVFRNDQGLVTKETFYRGDDVYEFIIYRYDEKHRRIREEHYDSDSSLKEIWKIDYHHGKEKSRTLFSLKGVKQYEIRGGHTHLYFDKTGENLIALKGYLPDDMDLAYGWGDPYDGLACGIAPSTLKAQSVKDFQFGLSVKNLTKRYKKVAFGSPFLTMQLELRDAQGTLIPLDVQHTEDRKNKIKQMNRGDAQHRGYGLETIGPNKVVISHSHHELGDWYNELSSGEYFLTVRYGLEDGTFSLVSNTVVIEIER